MHGSMKYSVREEIANAISHGIGAMLSAAALAILVVFACIHGDAWHIVSFSIFGTTLVLLYTCSTLLHSFQEGKVKDIFEILDYSAIYLLIAGTYTPFLLVTLRGPLGWSIFGIVWGLAVCGIVFKAYFVNKFMMLSTLFYIGMGWLIVFAIKPLYEQLPWNGLLWLVGGGIFYTVGTVFFIWRKFPYHHAVWHTFVVCGSVCHFIAILFYVLPMPGVSAAN